MAARSTAFRIMVLFKYVSPCKVLPQIKKHYSYLLFLGHFDLRLEVIPTRISLTRKVCIAEGTGYNAVYFGFILVPPPSPLTFYMQTSLSFFLCFFFSCFKVLR